MCFSPAAAQARSLLRREAPIETAEGWPRPFLAAKTLQYRLKAMGTLVFARLNVSILLHP